MSDEVLSGYVKLFPRPNSEPASLKLEPTNNYVAVASPYNWKYYALAANTKRFLQIQGRIRF